MLGKLLRLEVQSAAFVMLQLKLMEVVKTCYNAKLFNRVKTRDNAPYIDILCCVAPRQASARLNSEIIQIRTNGESRNTLARNDQRAQNASHSIPHIHAGRIFTSSNSPPTSSFLIVPEAVDPCDEAAIVGLLKLTGTSPSKSRRRLDSICTRGVVPIMAPPGVRRHAC